MFRAVSKTLKLLFHYFRFNLSAGMEYRVSFLVQVGGMILNNSAFIFIWLILFDRIGGNISGYNFDDVMFLWSLSSAGFGISAVFMGNAPFLSRLIYSGELDVYLLQPKPLLLNVICSRMSISGWGDIFYGLVLFAATQELYPFKIILFLVFIILFSIILTSLRIIYHSLTFFLGNAEDFAGTASELSISFTLYPGSIFKGPSIWLLHSLLPAALMAYIPIRLIKSFDPLLALILIGSDLLLVSAAFGIFHIGLRKYESGNKIGTRL